MDACTEAECDFAMATSFSWSGGEDRPDRSRRDPVKGTSSCAGGLCFDPPMSSGAHLPWQPSCQAGERRRSTPEAQNRELPPLQVTVQVKGGFRRDPGAAFGASRPLLVRICKRPAHGPDQWSVERGLSRRRARIWMRRDIRARAERCVDVDLEAICLRPLGHLQSDR